MADSPAFDFVCAELERRSSLDRLQARGTVRIALKAAGLEARSVTPEQMAVVVARMLPAELGARAVADAEPLCRDLGQAVATLRAGPALETPDAVFQRLGG